MKRIINAYPSAANPIIIEKDPWNFEVQEGDIKDKFKMFTVTEGTPLDFFVTAEDFHPSLKGIKIDEYGNEIEEEITKRDSDDGEEKPDFQIDEFKFLKFKIKLKKEEEKIFTEEGIYYFNFLDNKKIALKHLTGFCTTSSTTIDSSTHIHYSLTTRRTRTPYDPRQDWEVEDFYFLDEGKIFSSYIRKEIELQDLLKTIELDYSFKVFSNKEKTQQIFPIYKDNGYYFEQGKTYYFVLESEEIVEKYTNNATNFLKLQGKASDEISFFKSNNYSKSAFYLNTGKNFLEKDDNNT